MMYDTRLDMIKMFLRIYNGYLDAMDKTMISDRTINLLSYYINYGYSEDTRAKYMVSFNTNPPYISVLDNELKRRGFLTDGNGNYKNRGLSMDMTNLRNYFVLDADSDDTRIMGFVFKRKGIDIGRKKETDIV